MRYRVAMMVVSGAFLAVTMPSRAADARLRALSSLQPGSWALKSADASLSSRTLCLGDPRLLLKVQRPERGCSRYVVVNERDMVTVHDTCPGAGHARTSVRVETSRLVQIDSQGIEGASPFAWSAEGRWVGQCNGASPR